MNPPTYNCGQFTRLIADELRDAHDHDSISTLAFINIVSRLADRFELEYSIRFDRNAFIKRCRVAPGEKDNAEHSEG